jgi:hypothetical protein
MFSALALGLPIVPFSSPASILRGKKNQKGDFELKDSH